MGKDETIIEKKYDWGKFYRKFSLDSKSEFLKIQNKH